MALGDFAKRLLGARKPQGEPSNPEPVSTGVDHCQPLPSGEQNCAPADDGDQLYVFGSLQSAKVHAERLRTAMIEVGLANRATWQGEIQEFHREMCETLGWVPRLWDAVGRELAKLPGVEKGTVKVNGQRLTVYEVREPAETANVVDLAAAERKRA